MLTELYIKNLATIDELTLEFYSKTTTITGETGAGKSILIEAIEIALGDRATPQWVRPGKEKAEIQVRFDISTIEIAQEWLKEHELNNQSNECWIRRVINKDGRSRTFINGIPSTTQLIRELSEHLLHIHGQYEHQALLKPEKQRELLDHYAGHHTLLTALQALANQWKLLTTEITHFQKQSGQDIEQSEWLLVKLKELDALQPNPDE